MMVRNCDWCRTPLHDKILPRTYEGVEVFVCSLCWKNREVKE